MNRSTQIWVGVVVLAGLAGLVAYKAKEDQKIGTAQTTNAELPELKAPEDVDKISVQNADKPEIVLEKKGDKWAVAKPVEAPANQANVDQIVKNLKDLKAKEVISAQPSEDSKKDYDLVPAKAVHVMAYKGGDKKVDPRYEICDGAPPTLSCTELGYGAGFLDCRNCAPAIDGCIYIGWHQPLITPHYMFDISATDDSSVYAVGPRGAVQHFDGHTWNAVDLSSCITPTDTELRAVHVRAADDIWIGGVDTTTNTGLALHVTASG